MTRAALLLALMAAGCAAARPAPISYGGAPSAPMRTVSERTVPVVEQRSGRGAPIEFRSDVAPAEPPRTPPPSERIYESPDIEPEPIPAPEWAAGEGTPLSAYARQPDPYDPSRMPRTHRVQPRETLSDIAARYRVPMLALIEQNGLQPPYELTPGRELELPPPRFHTVARNETFEQIADAYSIDARSLALLNNMQPPYNVRPGQRLALPAVAQMTPPPAAPEPRVAPPTIAANARFAMPLRGQIVAWFGAQPGGVRLDGIEIAGREGDAVRAAADGEVVYAGDDLPGYGTLVLVRHADNYVTAYGYARRAFVREGQHVRAGEQVAELGMRPDGRARLLFQVRQGAAAVDPAPLLGVSD